MTDPIARLNAALSDRYRIESEIGSGGMATVYLAQDLKHDRKVAVKVLKPELAAVVGSERFLAEIKTTANLQHPHILPLFDSGQADSFLFFVMPHVEGESLRDRLDREGELPVEEAVRIATAVASALDYAHRHGVIHRDIKPANILLHDGQPLVADFGIALAVSAAGGGRLTETGLSLGTPYYMSPEQATAERDPDPRSDVYALGCVLYEMLVGEPPYTGATAQAVLGKILTTDPVRLTEHRRAIPPHVEAAVLRALEKRPADRFRSAADFAEALESEAFLRSAYGSPGTGPSSRRQLVTPAVLVAAAVILVVATAGVMWKLGPQATPMGPMGDRPFTFAFSLEGVEQIAVDMDQILLDISDESETMAWLGVVPGAERQIFYRSVRDLPVRPVPGTKGTEGYWLHLSPDGSRVSYWRQDPAELWAADLDGESPPQRIFEGRLWSWTWAPDGSFVLAEPYQGLVRLSEPGAEPELLTRLEGDEVTHQFPQVLPDGRSILFSVGVGHFHTTHIEVLTRERGEDRRKVLLEGPYSATYVPSGHLVFGRGDQVLSVPFDLESLSVTGSESTVVSGVQTDLWGVVTEFAVSRNGTLVYLPHQGLADYQLAWVQADGILEWLDVSPAPLWQPWISPDGGSVALSARMEGDRRLQLYLIDLNRLVPRPITDVGVSENALWSRDGEQLVFNSTRDGHLNLYRAPARGGAQVTRVTRSDLDQHPVGWATDGRLVILERLPFDSVRFAILSSSEEDPGSTPLTDKIVSRTWGTVSPDGRWLAYERENEIFLREIPTEGEASGGEERVSAAGGVSPRWTRDGRRLLYGSSDRTRILEVDIDTQAGLPSGREREVFRAPDEIELNLTAGFDVSRDGQILVVARPRRTAPMEVVVSMNRIGERD